MVVNNGAWVAQLVRKTSWGVVQFYDWLKDQLPLATIDEEQWADLHHEASSAQVPNS